MAGRGAIAAPLPGMVAAGLLTRTIRGRYKLKWTLSRTVPLALCPLVQDMKRRHLFISAHILCWRPELPGGIILPHIEKQRAYDHLRRAEHFLGLGLVSDADRADCLSNLRRTVINRVQLLEKLYKLRSPLQVGAKKHFLEILAQVGIVRPSFLRALLEASTDPLKADPRLDLFAVSADRAGSSSAIAAVLLRCVRAE